VQLFFYISLIIAFFDFLFKCYGIIWVGGSLENVNFQELYDNGILLGNMKNSYLPVLQTKQVGTVLVLQNQN
jgi:uncharacterized protein with PQ loop repeat